MKHFQKHSYDNGYLAIEMLITVITAAIFITTFYQLFTVINNSYITTRDIANANNLAYSYLREYSSRNPVSTWFVCDTTVGAGNTNDLTQNATAAGQLLKGGSLTQAESNLPGTVTYSVRAFAIYGCSGSNIQSPIRVDALVNYGISGSRTIKHSAIVGY